MPTTSATTRRRSTVAVRGDLWTMGIFFSAELQTWRRRERATSGAIEVPRRLADLRYHMVPARRTKQVIPLVSEHIGQAIAHASADLDEGDVAAVDARVAQRLDAALMPSRKLPLGQNTSCTASACNGALVSARMHSLLAYTVPACGATAGSSSAIRRERALCHGRFRNVGCLLNAFDRSTRGAWRQRRRLARLRRPASRCGHSLELALDRDPGSPHAARTRRIARPAADGRATRSP